jgi:hypothetical protein
MYDRIEIELRGVHQSIPSSCAVPTVPLPSGEIELGDKPAQLHRPADTVEARLRHTQEEMEQATQALKQVQVLLIEKCIFVEKEKVSIQAKFEEERAQMKQEKE